MPRQKPSPLPPMKAHNFRKRAEQMEVVAEVIETESVKQSLRLKAQALRALADAEEKRTPRKPH